MEGVGEREAWKVRGEGEGWKNVKRKGEGKKGKR